MKVTIKEKDLARLVKVVRYSKMYRKTKKELFILGLDGGGGLLVCAEENGHSAFCKIVDNWYAGSSMYRNFLANFWLDYEGGDVDFFDSGYSFSGKTYTDELQTWSGCKFYELAIKDEPENRNGAPFSLPCKIKKSECLLLSGCNWYTIGFKNDRFTERQNFGKLEGGAVDYTALYAGLSLYRYDLKPGARTQLFFCPWGGSVLRCYYDKTDNKEFIMMVGAPSSGTRTACGVVDIPFIEREGEEKQKENATKEALEKLQNNNQNINRLKKRVDVLKRRQGTAWKNYVFDGGTIEADVAENRYKIFYDEKPEQKIIDALKASGWRWSRWGQCWQRMLNEATVRAIKNHNAWAHLADYLPGLTEDTGEPEEPESVDAELTEQPEGLQQEPTESEPEPMEIKPEPKTREPEPEPIQDNEPEGAEPLDEPEPETKEEAEMQAEKKPTRAELLEMAIESFRNGYTDKQYLETLIEEMQAEKGYLTFNELYKVCETVNKSAWNVTFIFRPYFYGKESARKIAPFEKVVVDCRFYAYSGDHWYDVERRQGIYSSIGNARAQFVVTVTCEIMDELKPTESVEKWGDNVCEEIRGKWILNNIGDWLNQDVKDSFKTVNDIKRRFYTYCGRPHWGNRCIDLEYYKDGKKLEKEPGGASLVADYTIERVPTESRVIFKIYLGKNGAAVVKPEPVKKPEKVKPDPAAIPEEKQAEAAVEPVAIPEPAEPQPETVETQPEQVEAVKPTEREIRYAMSLLAMNFSRSDLVEKWLKRTKKPVRHDIVEKLIWTLDRTKVPAPGASKKEAIKAVMATN